MNSTASAAKKASIKLAVKNSDEKNTALTAVKNALLEKKSAIIEANKKDLERSEKENLAAPLLKRLKFDEKKIDAVCEGIESLISLPEPVGKTLSATELDKGLELYKVSCPIGVIGVIFESRPDALVQISTLCLKSGNSLLLKGGSEARETNRILADIIAEASINAGLPENWISLMETRSEVGEMLKCDKYIDLIIPRGSNEFVKYIMDNSNIPVLGHADGICHCYIDENYNLEKALAVTIDSKTQYVAVCNALETLLVHKNAADKFLPELKNHPDFKSVTLKGCPKTLSIIDAEPADESDWATEYLDYTLSIKIVSDIDEALDHINQYGSGHTESIVTEDTQKAVYFMESADSGNVFHNCSTRFSDGFRYGFGAEVGISTNKIHARGPVGLDGLLIYKYKVKGNGHIVSDYAEGKKSFTHRKMDKTFQI